MKTFLLCVVLAGACGKSSRSVNPATRCREAIAHMDSLTTAQPPATGDDPPAPPGAAAPGQPPAAAADRAKQQREIDQARAAGILADPMEDCIASWTNATIDCVLAAKNRATADACVPKRGQSAR